MKVSILNFDHSATTAWVEIQNDMSVFTTFAYFASKIAIRVFNFTDRCSDSIWGLSELIKPCFHAVRRLSPERQITTTTPLLHFFKLIRRDAALQGFFSVQFYTKVQFQINLCSSIQWNVQLANGQYICKRQFKFLVLNIPACSQLL